MAGVRITQQAPVGLSGQRYGSFVGKTETAEPDATSVGAWAGGPWAGGAWHALGAWQGGPWSKA